MDITECFSLTLSVHLHATGTNWEGSGTYHAILIKLSILNSN